MKKFEAEVSMTCDVCGRESKYEDWGIQGNSVNEITIQTRCVNKSISNVRYREYDICPNCFDKHIKDVVFKDVEPRIYNIEY